MTLAVSKVGNNANISACKNMYQAYALGYSTYQSDYSGASPGELSNLSRFGYVDPKLQNNANFTIQDGVYAIKSYFLSGTSLALQFKASWLSSSKAPPGKAGNLVLISNLDPAIDGMYQMTLDPTFVSSDSTGATYATAVTFVNSLSQTSNTYTDSPNPPSTLSILSLNSDITSSPATSFEIYLFDSNGSRVRSDMILPEACGYLN